MSRTCAASVVPARSKPRESPTDDSLVRGRPVLLKWILNLLAAFLLIRFFRGLLRPRPPVGNAN